MSSRWLNIGQVLLCMFMDRNKAILTEKVWPIKDSLCRKRTISANGTQRVIPSERNSRATLHARDVNHSAVFGSFIPLAEPGSRIVNTFTHVKSCKKKHSARFQPNGSSGEPLNFTWIRQEWSSFCCVQDRMWRKNRSLNPGSKCVGTDLNRNWALGWGGMW